MIGWVISLLIFASPISSVLSTYINYNRGQSDLLIVFIFFILGILFFIGSIFFIFLWYREDQRNRRESQQVGAKTIEQLAFIKKYKAPDYETAQLVSNGDFPDYETYIVACQFGVKFMSELRLIQRFNTPDYETALKVREGGFSTYKSFQEAQEVGAKSKDEFLFIREYNASSYSVAIEFLRNEYEEKLKSDLIQNGRIFISKFIALNKIQKVSRVIMKEVIHPIEMKCIFSDNDEVVVLIDFLRKKLKEAAKHYADIPYNIVAKQLDVPEKYIPDLLVKAIDTNIVIGKLDRINQCIIVRDIPDSLIDRLIAGEISSIDQIKKTFNESLETSCKILQNELSSTTAVLVRLKGVIKTEKLTVSCQICTETKSNIELFLKCNQCHRDLCWAHYEELSMLGRAICPYCDNLLAFLPKYCEKCHLDFILIPKQENTCDFCGYPLSVKNHITTQYNSFLTQQQNQKIPIITEDEISKSKKP